MYEEEKTGTGKAHRALTRAVLMVRQRKFLVEAIVSRRVSEELGCCSGASALFSEAIAVDDTRRWGEGGCRTQRR